jgi:hypothetical protein
VGRELNQGILEYVRASETTHVCGVLAVALLRISFADAAESSLIRVVQNILCPPNYPKVKSLPTCVLAGRQPITRHPWRQREGDR